MEMYDAKISSYQYSFVLLFIYSFNPSPSYMYVYGSACNSYVLTSLIALFQILSYLSRQQIW